MFQKEQARPSRCAVFVFALHLRLLRQLKERVRRAGKKESFAIFKRSSLPKIHKVTINKFSTMVASQKILVFKITRKLYEL